MVQVYTDGATSNNGYDGSYGGWAFIIVKDRVVVHEEKGYLENTTNNKCELTAIIKGCERATELFYDEEVEILSDSAYCVNCYLQEWYKKWMDNGWINSKKEPVANQELWAQLIPYFENPKFNFKKVKGHSTNKFNNIVDKMAVEAKIC